MKLRFLLPFLFCAPALADVTDSGSRIQYVSAAAQTEFDYTFEITAEADLSVYVNDEPQTLTTDYTVEGEGEDDGGSITFVTALEDGDIVTIIRDTAIERDTNFGQNSGLSSAAFNREFDKLYTITQELEQKINRALRIPLTAEIDDDEIALDPISAYASKLLGFDANGIPEPVDFADTDGTPLSASTVGAVLYPQTAAELAAGNLCTSGCLLQYPPGNVLRYGGSGNDSTNNDTALSFVMLQQAQTGGVCGYIPPGTYRFTTLAGGLDHDGWCIEGDGWVDTILKYMGTGDALVVGGRHGIFRGIWLQNGSTNGNNGLVLWDANSTLVDESNFGGAGGGLEALGFDEAGILIDQAYDTPAGNNNSIVIRNSFTTFNNDGIEITIGSDHQDIRVEGHNSSANIQHGAILRGQAGRVRGGIYEGNGGYGLTLGADGDGTVVSTWTIDFPYIESNTSGGVYGSDASQANLVLLDGLNVNSNYVGHASAENISVWADNTSGGKLIIGDATQGLAIYNVTVGSDRVQVVAEGSGSNIPLWLYSKGTSPIVLNESVGTGVVIGGQAVDASALLQIDSTSKGVLLPRMDNAQEAAISGPDDGLLWYNSETDKLMIRANGVNVAVH